MRMELLRQVEPARARLEEAARRKDQRIGGEHGFATVELALLQLLRPGLLVTTISVPARGLGVRIQTTLQPW